MHGTFDWVPAFDKCSTMGTTCMELHLTIFTVHDPDYRQALQDFNTFLEKLSEKIIEADATIPELPVKDIVCWALYVEIYQNAKK
jgi:hypothetical protein